MDDNKGLLLGKLILGKEIVIKKSPFSRENLLIIGSTGHEKPYKN